MEWNMLEIGMSELTEDERDALLDATGLRAYEVGDLFAAVARIKADAAREAYDKGHAAGVAEGLRVAAGSPKDLRDVGAWLVREADRRVEFFPQRRDGVDDVMRAVASALFRAALAGTSPQGEGFCSGCPDHEACATGWPIPCPHDHRDDATDNEKEN